LVALTSRQSYKLSSGRHLASIKKPKDEKKTGEAELRKIRQTENVTAPVSPQKQR